MENDKKTLIIATVDPKPKTLFEHKGVALVQRTVRLKRVGEMPENALKVQMALKEVLPMPLDKYLDIKSANIEFNLKIEQLRKLCREKKLEASKEGGKWVISRTSLENFVNQNKNG